MMERPETKVRRFSRLNWEMVSGFLLCLALFCGFLYTGRIGYSILFGLLVLLGGWYVLLNGEADCPIEGCGAKIEAMLGRNRYVKCRKCGTYFEGKGGRLWPMEEDHLAGFPMFDVSLPTKDKEETLTPAGATLAPVPAPLKGEDRVYEFSWPPGCCVCGKPAAQAETVMMTARTKSERAAGLLEERVAIAVGGIPHCPEHRMGASLAIDAGHAVLKFRSLAYRNAFRRLNQL
jgi:hypothetical protein